MNKMRKKETKENKIKAKCVYEVRVCTGLMLMLGLFIYNEIKGWIYSMVYSLLP